MSEELGPVDASYYHSLIGILSCIVELGRVDINYEVSIVSSHLALPREGHLQELFHIFAYLKKRMNSEMVFDTILTDIDIDSFHPQDCNYSIYSIPGEELKGGVPPDMPAPIGMGLVTHAFIGAYHNVECLTR